MTTPDAPVRKEDRLNYMDVLRGFAVMAIFIVNIKMMFAPSAYYMNGSLWSGDNDLLIASLQEIFVDNKWRTNFSALFGAGIILMTMKGAEKGIENVGLIRRRMLWLLIFGLVHGLFIWSGDILATYALVGFIALLYRNKSTASLFKWGSIFLIVGGLWFSYFNVLMAIDPMIEFTEPEMWGTDSETMNQETDAFLGNILDQTIFRLIMVVSIILVAVPFAGLGMLTLGIMLMGMALFRTGFLKGQWSALTYLALAVVSLGAAWGIELYRVNTVDAAEHDFRTYMSLIPFGTLAGLVGAFGYAALVGFLTRIGIKFSPVAAVGRMAFTNYIACSVIGTTMAYGHAGAMFGTLNLEQLMMIVGGTFVAMLIWSPIWLAFFRFGPLEWLWRSLTYGKIQPLLK